MKMLCPVLVMALLAAASAGTRDEDNDPHVREVHQQFDELCAIWRKTDKVEKPVLTSSELGVLRYWLVHEPVIWYSQDFPRMAAITLGNVRDKASYEQLERLYLDTSRDPARYDGVRAEAFYAIAKIAPDRAAKYVIKELTSDDISFVITAQRALKEAYGTSLDLIEAKRKKADRAMGSIDRDQVEDLTRR